MPKSNLYLQTRWVEDEIARKKKLRNYQVYIDQFRKEMDNRYGDSWRKEFRADRADRSYSIPDHLIRKNARIEQMKEEVAMMKLLDRDNNHVPPPLQF